MSASPIPTIPDSEFAERLARAKTLAGEAGYDIFLVNSTEADFRPVMEAYKEVGCRGIGEYMPNLPMDDPLNMNLFAQAQEMELPLLFHLTTRLGGHYGPYDDLNLNRLETVLKSFPKLKLIAHACFWYALRDGDVDDNQRFPGPGQKSRPGRAWELMRNYPNLYADLCGQSGNGGITGDLELGLEFLEEFQDRLLFGTDIAYYPMKAPIIDLFAKIKSEKLVSDEVYEKITWRNTDRLLNLGLQ